MNMSDHRTDEAVGRAKEAAGSLTGKDDLKREGKTDRAASSVKEKVKGAKDKTDDAVDAAKRKVSGRD
jgi:uncharacterized protein YjbJ (UPF0337 family)